MADQDAVAATLTGAIVQGRATRAAAQARIANSPSVAAGNPSEVADIVRLYLDVLRELQSQTATPKP
jgi:hypothetical protein